MAFWGTSLSHTPAFCTFCLLLLFCVFALPPMPCPASHTWGPLFFCLAFWDILPTDNLKTSLSREDGRNFGRPKTWDTSNPHQDFLYLLSDWRRTENRDRTVKTCRENLYNVAGQLPSLTYISSTLPFMWETLPASLPSCYYWETQQHTFNSCPWTFLHIKTFSLHL